MFISLCKTVCVKDDFHEIFPVSCVIESRPRALASVSRHINPALADTNLTDHLPLP